MTMTRKHYREFAEEIKHSLHADMGEGGDGQAVARTARGIASALKADNSRFSYSTFFEACGLDCNGDPPEPEDDEATVRALKRALPHLGSKEE